MKDSLAPRPIRPTPEWMHWMLWCAAVLPVAWRQISTSDCWWQVALGRWLVERRSLPDFAQFYFTPTNARVPDLRWTAGGDIFFYLLHAAGGPVALQALSFACLALGCVLLRRLHAGPMNGWVTALLTLVAFGTYQLQLPRNAVFSLPLTALLFLLFSRFRASRRPVLAWMLPLTVGAWSFLHASCLLGCVLVVLLLAADAIEGLFTGFGEGWRRAGFAALLAAITIGAVTLGNPAASRMLRRPFDHVLKPNAAERQAAKKRPAESPPREPRNAKEWLNNLIWPAIPGKVRSADFASPLDRLDYRPVVVAFALIALALVWAACARRPPFPWIVTCAATTLLALSYFRMTGYGALGAAALLLSCGPLRGRMAEALGRRSGLGAAATGGAAMALWVAGFAGALPRVIGDPLHVAGFGNAPTFDEAAARWLLERHPAQRTFTTIVTGSFALHEWRWRKPVFIDGFFAPHADSVWTDYLRARQEPERDLLHERYEIEFALVEHTRPDWNRVFLLLPDWQPAAIGPGCAIYARRSTIGDAPPELLVSPAAAEKLPLFFRRALARNYYAAILALLAADRPEAARKFVDAAPEAYRHWRGLLLPEDTTPIREMDAALGFESITGFVR